MGTDKIKFVAADFQKATAELQRIEGLLNDYQTELAGKYSMIQKDWQGQAGAAFGDCSQKVISSFRLHIESLQQLAADINQIGQYMKEVDSNIAETIANA